MGTLHKKIFGLHEGNFDPDQPDFDDLLDNLANYLVDEDLKSIVWPSCAFTNRIAVYPQGMKKWSEGLLSTAQPADGIIIKEDGVACAIFNADCPVVIIGEEDSDRLAIIHAGFRNLIRKDKKDFSILRAPFAGYGFDPKKSIAWIGYGIGPCCYGAEHLPEIDDPTVDLPIGRATRGPRSQSSRPARSVDLYELIRRQLLKLQMNPRRIIADPTCTSCAGFSRPEYHSNCRDGAQAGRNLVLVWFTK